jgi:putative ABC transport system ATP-binding protein
MGKIQVEALRDLDMEVKAGEYIAILGPSGSGKSTLLNMLGALDKPTSGTVFIDGVDMSTLNSDELARIRRRKIGFVFQFFALMPRMTALQNVELSLSIAGVGGSSRRKRAAELLEVVGLGERMRHRPTELSGGEQQRVAIARALANNPSYVLLDEPSGNLDQATGHEIAELLNELNENQGTTFVVVTHDPKMAQEADRILRMTDGEIVQEVSSLELV